MKSIKRGRGPSFMGGVGAVFAAIFGVIWMGAALSMGGGGLFACFGLVFIGFAVVNAIYNFKNASGEQRYSEYDIVDSGEEDDPLNDRFGQQSDEWARKGQANEEFAFCPYCGTKREKDHVYCGKCGKRIG